MKDDTITKVMNDLIAQTMMIVKKVCNFTSYYFKACGRMNTS